MAIGISIFRKHIHDLRQMRAEDKTIHLFIHKHLIIRLPQRFAITSHCRDAKFCVSTAGAQHNHLKHRRMQGNHIPHYRNIVGHRLAPFAERLQFRHQQGEGFRDEETDISMAEGHPLLGKTIQLLHQAFHPNLLVRLNREGEST